MWRDLEPAHAEPGAVSAVPKTAEMMWHKISNAAERRFAQHLDDQGKLWFWQPKGFLLSNKRLYFPDFYVVEDQCFYEVCGTRQAYSYQRKNIERFRASYPKLRIETVNEGAWKNGPGNPFVSEPRSHRDVSGLKRPHTRLFSEEKIASLASLPQAIARAFQASGLKTLSQFAEEIGISSRTLHAIRRERNPIRIAEQKVMTFLNRPHP